MKNLNCPFCGTAPACSDRITMGSIVEYRTCNNCGFSLPAEKWQVRLSEGDSGLISGLKLVLNDLKNDNPDKAEKYIENLLDSHNLL